MKDGGVSSVDQRSGGAIRVEQLRWETIERRWAIRCNAARLNWLPTEGTDFEVRMSSTTVNGVTIEGESYYSL